MSNIEIKGNAAHYLGRIAEALEGEQAFWDRAFAAALSAEVTGSMAEDVNYACRVADAALAARRARIEGKKDE